MSSLNSLERNPFKDHDEDKIFHELSDEVLESITSRLQENATYYENSLILCDDFASSLKDGAILKSLNHLAHNRRHYRVSIWMLTQGTRFLPRSFRRLITHLTLWKFNHQDEMKNVKEEFSPLPSQQMNEVFRYAYQKKHDFLYFDLEKQKIYRNFNKLIISPDDKNAIKTESNQTKTKSQKTKPKSDQNQTSHATKE